jgi:hypothetical protein
LKPTNDALLVEDQNNTMEAVNISVSKEIKQNKDNEIRNESLEAASDAVTLLHAFALHLAIWLVIQTPLYHRGLLTNLWIAKS